jgi:hypothetical protein
MSPTPTPPLPVDPARRHLLSLAPLVAAAPALSLLGTPAQAAAPAAAPSPEAQGYHETEHIRRYYRSAR